MKRRDGTRRHPTYTRLRTSRRTRVPLVHTGTCIRLVVVLLPLSFSRCLSLPSVSSTCDHTHTREAASTCLGTRSRHHIVRAHVRTRAGAFCTRTRVVESGFHGNRPLLARGRDAFNKYLPRSGDGPASFLRISVLAAVRPCARSLAAVNVHERRALVCVHQVVRPPPCHYNAPPFDGEGWLVRQTDSPLPDRTASPPRRVDPLRVSLFLPFTTVRR